MTEQPEDQSAPIHGVQHAIPWPLPLLPGGSAFTFRGVGNQTTQEFVLPGDAALRIAAEKGPFQLHVRRHDGSVLNDATNLPDGGLALMAISEGGTYKLEIQSPARWGVTVVYQG